MERHLDGAYLSELLLARGYQVHGIKRRASSFIIQQIRPDEIYNLGAQSHVQVSFETPEYTANSDALGTLRIQEAMWLMLQQDEPQDLVIATGETRTVREFVVAAFARAGVTLEWKGRGVGETGTIAALAPAGEAAREGALAPGQVVVSVDPRYFRPTEVELLLGDPSRAKEALGWTPRVSFAELVEMMVDSDLEQQKRERYLKDGGYEVNSTFE